MEELNSTADFYKNLLPVVNGTSSKKDDTFKNAYIIYDLINVARVHNSSIPSGNLLTPEVVQQLQVLANIHEMNLAFNASEPVGDIQVSTHAAQIVQQLNSTIVGKSKSQFDIQFGAYASFLSFSDRAQHPKISDNFTGIVNSASSMTFELITNATVSNISYPLNDDISVRFLFSNGSASETLLVAYPLFGQSETFLPWNTFVADMAEFAVGTQADWCTQCGNSTGICAPSSASMSADPAATRSSSSSGGISKAVAGVIGAMVTLGAILRLEGLILLVGGLRLVSKRLAIKVSPEHISAEAKARQASKVEQ